MKPTNSDGQGCDPISSNCVIWQGPDLECIDLCKGDSVSSVVNKLATELCDLLGILNVDLYDVSCFNLAECTPKDFKGLIQVLIDQICKDNNIEQEGVVGGCPDCEVSIAECFYFTTPTGDTATSMQLKDYVLAIGNQVCELTGAIGTINLTLGDHNQRISALEAAGTPVVTLPTVTPQCVLPSAATPLDAVLTALEEQFCQLRTYTGDTNAISAALQAACIGLNTANKLQGSGQMQDIAGWYPTPTSMAQSFSNMWKTICDMRSAVQFIKDNCCDTSCSAIDLILLASLTDPTTLRLDFTGSIPSIYTDGSPASTIELSDAGGGGPQILNNQTVKSSYFDPSQPQIINLVGVDGALDVSVKLTLRLVDPVSGSACETVVQTIALGTDSCPALILVANYFGVAYSFTWNGTIPTVVTMEVYDAAGTTLVQSSTLSITSSSANGSFTNLAEGTSYKIRVVIGGIPCQFADFTTLEYPCVAPSLLAPTIDYTDNEGDTTGSTIEAWIAEYILLNP